MRLTDERNYFLSRTYVLESFLLPLPLPPALSACIPIISATIIKQRHVKNVGYVSPNSNTHVSP